MPNSSGTPEPETIGRYRVTRRLGQGGMGVVYAAHDDRLERDVAIKRIRNAAGDAALRERLLREARAAARINHPNICHVYELAEEGEELYLVMELLEGEALEQRLTRDRITVAEALRLTLGVLSALEALHARGIIHRDLKPSNVFLTPHGVKLLDFGLARPVAEQFKVEVTLTQPGTLMGTPRYMSPEQWEGQPLTPASDLFAVGAILFEMLAGKPAFPGSTIIEVFRAVAIAEPPALAGGPEVMAADRIIQLAIAKRAADRYPDAAVMAREVREALALVDTGGSSPQARAMTRLIVLPFRILRPDPEIDFLAFGVPDAITSSLSGLESLVVRSTAAGQRFAGASDLKTIAAEAGVDVVVTGTLLRAGDQVRVSTQMLEAPSGTLLSSSTAQVALTDVFQLQDDLARQIVDSLALPLSSRDRGSLGRQQPLNAKAYDLYLRANHLGANTSNPARLAAARDLYRRCLDEDPGYAPAWARLGRVYRVLAKYGAEGQAESIALAEEAFRRALEIDPDLAVAHNFYTYFEIEEKARAPEAMVRLLERVGRGAADPHLFAGLVVACRFCGLLGASLAADRRARRIDPSIQTSVQYTYWAMGDYHQAALHDVEDIQAIRHGALWMLGRYDEALAGVREALTHAPGSLEHWIVESQLAAMEGRPQDCLRHARAILDAGFHDPEGLLLHGRELAFLGLVPEALGMLQRVVDGGYHCPTLLTIDPWLDALRGEAAFVRAVRQAEAGRARAAEAFARAGGERVLGVGTG
ncbi:MAG TPA: protein kinase [Gemmatimonadales bacterium]|nr:protein kinase [Gemmatimonadales bacterium]